MNKYNNVIKFISVFKHFDCNNSCYQGIVLNEIFKNNAIKRNLIKSHATRLKSTKYKTHVMEVRIPLKMNKLQPDESILRLTL